MEIAIALITILLTTVGVYYTREQVMAQRRERSSIGGETLTLAKTSSKDVLKKIKAKKLLRVGCLWYPPFVEYVTKEESVMASGLYPEILIALAKNQGISVQFFVLKWHEAIEALNNSKIDVVACVLKSADRRANCDFVGTIFRVGVGGVVRLGQKKIQTLRDLARNDISIAVTKGEIGWTYATENLGLPKYPLRFTVLEDKNIQTAMSLVEKGVVDCALADSLSCAQFIENATGGLQPLSDVFKTTPIHVEDNALMVAKGNHDFVEWLESGIDEIRSQPSVKLFERQIETQYSGILHYTGEVG